MRGIPPPAPCCRHPAGLRSVTSLKYGPLEFRRAFLGSGQEWVSISTAEEGTPVGVGGTERGGFCRDMVKPG